MLIEFWNIVVKVVSHYKYANTVENIRVFRFSKGGCYTMIREPMSLFLLKFFHVGLNEFLHFVSSCLDIVIHYDQIKVARSVSVLNFRGCDGQTLLDALFSFRLTASKTSLKLFLKASNVIWCMYNVVEKLNKLTNLPLMGVLWKRIVD